MIYYVSGPVTVLEPGLAVIECGGVGYGCRVTAYTAAQLKLGKGAKLFFTESIREDAFDLYGFIGGAVWVEDRIVAMALGEKQGDTLYVHIEKADIRYHGAYQMIVREFSKYACTDEIRYINREDDAGDEGLRKSKLAWRPCGLLDKYLVHID